jgi:hypothetical protein
MQGFIVPDILPPTTEAQGKCVAVLPDLHAAIPLLRQAIVVP